MGNNTKNIIDINGRQYDAVSGTPVSGRATKTGKSVDGFTAAAAAGVPGVTKTGRSSHTPAQHLAPHRPQRAATLMRSAVKKPNLKSTRIASQSPTDVLIKAPAHTITTKLSHTTIDPRRQKRASRTIQSPAVSRFANISTVDSISAPQPALSAFTPQSSSLAGIKAGTSNQTQAIPVQPIGHITRQPDIFEQALARASNNPTAVKHSKKRRPMAGLVTASLAVLLVAGIFVYFNAPALSLRLASSKAGFEARLPNYSPAGFALGDLSYSPGNVVVNYKAAENDTRQFDITQRVSNWDSEGLLSNFVSTAASAYQTYERAGRTVYFYGDNSATWVDSGVWYIIDGSNSLTKNQILDMAGSL